MVTRCAHVADGLTDEGSRLRAMSMDSTCPIWTPSRTPSRTYPAHKRNAILVPVGPYARQFPYYLPVSRPTGPASVPYGDVLFVVAVGCVVHVWMLWNVEGAPVMLPSIPSPMRLKLGSPRVRLRHHRRRFRLTSPLPLSMAAISALTCPPMRLLLLAKGSDLEGYPPPHRTHAASSLVGTLQRRPQRLQADGAVLPTLVAAGCGPDWDPNYYADTAANQRV